MSSYAKLYWLTRLDNINFFIGALCFLFFITFVTFLIINIANDDDVSKEMKRKFTRITWMSGILFLMSFILFILTPTKKDVIFIIAGGKTIDFVQQDSSINKIPGQTTKIISDFLDKKIKEMEADTVK